MGGCRRSERAARLGLPSRGTRHPRRVPPPSRAARFTVPLERRRVPAVPTAGRLVADPRPPRRRGVVMTSLDQLLPGQKAEVVSLSGEPGLVQRFYELGLMEGEEVELVAF